MNLREDAWAAHQRARWLRPDAERWLKPDWRERKYNPDQPRVPAGSSDGGQWTSGEGGTGGGEVLSDATPDGWKPGAQYAQARTPRGPVQINGHWVQPTPAQAARLSIAEARAREAINRVQELDPTWRPTPGVYQSVEGLIRTREGEAQQAQVRFAELQRHGIGLGQFAGELIQARGPERNFTASEHREINRIGRETGCHTCGTFEPGTPRGNFVLDHQLPTRWNPLGKTQRLFPQCATCSQRQGGWITNNAEGW